LKKILKIWVLNYKNEKMGRVIKLSKKFLGLLWSSCSPKNSPCNKLKNEGVFLIL